MKTFCHSSPKESRQGFSLMELLSVLAIMSIVAGISLPAYQTIIRSSDMTTSANLVVDQIRLARQMAVTMNRIVELRVYQIPSANNAATTDYRAFRIVAYDAAGANPEPVSKMQVLPASVIVSTNTNWSTLLKTTTTAGSTPATGNESLPRYGNTPYIAFDFRPNGSTNLDLSGGALYTVTLIFQSDSARTTLPSNFFTAQVDPITGKVQTFRPGA